MRTRAGLRIAVPALLTAVAYVDPGNFGVNLTAGSGHGYALVWVCLLAGATAALIQYLAAKLGAASRTGLADNMATRSRPVVRAVAWLQAELIVLMTDLAELVGGALALSLLFGLPLPIGAIVIGAVSLGVMGLRWHGRSGYEAFVLALLAVIVLAVAAEFVLLRIDPVAVTLGSVAAAGRPLDADAMWLAVGIIGATVMPHALHVHSALSTPTTKAIPDASSRRRIVRTVIVAMGIASLTNVGLIVLGAQLPLGDGAELVGAHAALAVIGPAASTLFAVALLASGLASTVIGAYTSQVIMTAFWRRPLAAWIRRALGIAPPVIVLLAGLDATTALVASQVVLSFALPGTLVPLVVLTARRSVMGAAVNHPVTTVLAGLAAAAIIVLDCWLIVVLITGG